MATALMLRPSDHGRAIPTEEFEGSVGQEGYQYELIDGRVYVTPVPDHPQNAIEEWLHDRLSDYRRRHPDAINYVSHKARVFVPGRPRPTAPEPDVAAYHDYPTHLPLRQRRWQDLSPVLVAEVVSDDDPDKDLVRNVGLYLAVPTIREYWILDPRPDPDRPTLLVYRRWGRTGRRWRRPLTVSAGDTYTTPDFLPGFALVVDPNG